MIILTSKEDFNKAKGKDLIDLECLACKKSFKIPKKKVKSCLELIKKGRLLIGSFCSNKCCGALKLKRKEVECKQCLKPFMKEYSKIKSRPNHFCSLSCSATYNNTHKKHGVSRSKLEKWLEIELIKVYPNLEFHFNRKDAINSELDIYIPSLSLAFELNGIFHYEPIFGEEKLKRTQNNDNRKFQACLDAKIELCIIDSSNLVYFKPERCQKYLDIIKGIIDIKLTKTAL